MGVSRTYAEKATLNLRATGVCAMSKENAWGIGLMLIGVALAVFVGKLLGAICGVIGFAIILWAQFRYSAWRFSFIGADASLLNRVVATRNALQKFLDEVGEEPPVDYHVNDGAWKIERKRYEDSVSKMHYGFQRRFAARVQDIIYRLGEAGMSDMPLNLAMDKPEKDQDTVKEIIARLTVIAGKLNKQQPRTGV
jgi:hypothetical protein